MDKKSKLFKILSDETRFQILEALRGREKSVNEITSIVGKSQPLVSINLRKMLDSGFISVRRDGKQMFYSIQSRMIYKVFNIFEPAKKIKKSKKK